MVNGNMRGEVAPQTALLTLTSPEKRVPQEHPIRRIKQLADRALKGLDAGHKAFGRQVDVRSVIGHSGMRFGDLKRAPKFPMPRRCEKGAQIAYAPVGELSPGSAHDTEEDAGEARRGENRNQATPASTHPSPRAVVGQRGARISRVPRYPDQYLRDPGIPTRGRAALAPGASAPRPEGPNELAADECPGSTLDSRGPRPASVAHRPPRRQNPRWEPSAVILLARFCAGDGPSPKRRAVLTATPR